MTVPYQTVQFQYAASALRLVAQDPSLSIEQKQEDIQARVAQLQRMAHELGNYWVAKIQPQIAK